MNSGGTACVTPYIDDLIVYSDTFEEHQRDVRKVLACLSKNKYFIQPPKCAWCCEYVKFVGGIVGNGLLAMDPEKIQAIDDWQKPTTVTELRSFLGMANYLKPWIDQYSEIASPLNGLLKSGKSVTGDWNDTCTSAFQRLKGEFSKAPILRLPDFDKPFFVVTDSCDHAVGGAVMQKYEHNGKEKLLPVMYYSRTMTSTQRAYPVREQEALAIYETFKKAEYLLLGSKFQIISLTDHHTLQQLTNPESHVSAKRLIRWQEYFSQFDFAITYVPGPLNFIGDGLSRSWNTPAGTIPKFTGMPKFPVVCALSASYDDRMLGIKYDQSTEFKEVFAALKSDDPELESALMPAIRYYKIEGDHLFYRDTLGRLALCVPEGHQILVGKNKVPLREVLVKECHDSPYMGHRGINKTYLQVRSLFYWKNMHKYVSRYVTSCVTCARAKASTRGEMGALKPNECPSRPFRSITMDFFSGMPVVTGMGQVLVVVDRFTKKIWGVPLKLTATALDVARALYDSVFGEHGWPAEIISDRDSKFLSGIWTEMYRIMGTKLRYGYAHHQRHDGQTEVIVRVMKDIMRCYIDFKQTNWLELLPEIVRAINNSVNADSKLTPNEVYYGRPIQRPLDLAFESIQEPAGDLKDWLLGVAVKRDLATEAVRKALVAFTRKHNETCPVLFNDPRMVVGSKVMVSGKYITQPGHHDRVSKKLLMKKVGPFVITARTGTTGFRLAMPGYPVHNEFHARSLTHFAEDLAFKSRTPPGVDHVNYQGDLFYVVEEICDRAIKWRTPYYFVTYKGYPMEEGCWIKEQQLMEDCPDLLAAYLKAHPIESVAGRRTSRSSKLKGR